MEKAVAFRTIMNGTDRDHPSEDALERFLLQRSEEDELEIVETHILACETCITRLETLEFNIEATKLALQSFRRTDRAAERAQSAESRTVPLGGSFKNLLSWLTLPKLSFAGATVAACALVFSFISVPRNVNLTAYRGAEANVVSQWVPLDLHLNARELTPGPVVVEVVDDQGGKIWQGKTVVQSNQIEVKVPRLKAAGHYLVQVYAGQDSSDIMLREFSIQTKPLF